MPEVINSAASANPKTGGIYTIKGGYETVGGNSVAKAMVKDKCM